MTNSYIKNFLSFAWQAFGCFLLVLIFLQGSFAQGNKATLIVISEKIGPVIDAEENQRFSLITYKGEFRCAVVLIDNSENWILVINKSDTIRQNRQSILELYRKVDTSGYNGKSGGDENSECYPAGMNWIIASTYLGISGRQKENKYIPADTSRKVRAYLSNGVGFGSGSGEGGLTVHLGFSVSRSMFLFKMGTWYTAAQDDLPQRDLFSDTYTSMRYNSFYATGGMLFKDDNLSMGFSLGLSVDRYTLYDYTYIQNFFRFASIYETTDAYYLGGVFNAEFQFLSRSGIAPELQLHVAACSRSTYLGFTIGYRLGRIMARRK